MILKVKLYSVALTFKMTGEDLDYVVNVNICNFAIFGRIFMKFSPKHKAKELGI